MKFLYVDESGDSGVSSGSPGNHFLLAGLVVDAVDYQAIIADLHRFRHHLASKYGLLLSEEIHASAFISKPGSLERISLNERLRILIECLDWCRQRPDLHLLTVGTDKRTAVGNTVFQDVWKQLLLLFDAHLAATGPTQGLVFCDNTDGAKLTQLLRALQRPAASAGEQSALQHLIGDPTLWDSRTSYLHQMVDVVAYFAKQLMEPNKRVRAKGAHAYFTRLKPINLLVRQNPSGICLI